MANKKYYVVWVGNQPGIYDTWSECQKQTNGVSGAKFKSFNSKEDAMKAYMTNRSSRPIAVEDKPKTYIDNSISVDAACSGNPGLMEYRGVITSTKREIFHFGPVPNGTNNIGEFLAIVHALGVLKQKNSNAPIYSDSMTAIAWVKNNKANTSIPVNPETQPMWSLIKRAEYWLHSNEYSNPILKWETKRWGESFADFGRK